MKTLPSILVAASVSALAWALALASCAPATACFRKSDCSSGYGCRHGTCQLLATGEAGESGDASSDASNVNDAVDSAGGTSQ